MTDNKYREVLKCLGKRIKELRKERGLTLRQMEIIHGYRHSDWRRLESHGADNMALLLEVARGFEISLSTLLNGLERCSTRKSRRKLKNEAQRTCACRGAPN